MANEGVRAVGSSSSPGIVRPDLPPDDIRLRAEAACQNAGFETKWQKREIPGRDESGDTHFLYAGFPNGRYTRWITISEGKAQLISSVGIRPAIALGEYEAILYKDTYEIEAQVRSLIPFSTNSTNLLSRLPGVILKDKSDERPGDEESDETETVSNRSWVLPFAADSDQTWTACIGASSSQFAIYKSTPGTLSNSITLQITGTRVSRHDDALNLLERISNAIFFETDLRYRISLSLTRLNSLARRRRTSPDYKPQPYVPRMVEISSDPPTLPRNSYPAKPLALYWYARSAANMPLLQYLASYQVLEHYFSTYYRREALDRIKQELLDPRFSPQNDTHLIRLLNLAAPQGKAFGGERDQLKATIRACVSVNHLVDYLKDPGREEFFTGKSVIRDVGRIDLKNSSSDLRDQAADRIYDIRCRIVHAKSDSGDRYPELLLPFSEEAESLTFDIDLIQYLAQRILIHQADPLRV